MERRLHFDFYLIMDGDDMAYIYIYIYIVYIIDDGII
jgi:hypothetical protein